MSADMEDLNAFSLRIPKALARSEVWAVDFEPQIHLQEPGKNQR
jgi:hypothetical protein